MDDLPGFGANGMRNDTCRACRGIDPESWGVGEYLDAFGGVGGTFWYRLRDEKLSDQFQGAGVRIVGRGFPETLSGLFILLGEDFLKRYPDYSSVDYTRYSLILTWCWYPISELDKASGYAVEDGPSRIKVESYFNSSRSHSSEDMYGGVSAFLVDRLPDETEIELTIHFGVFE